YTRLRGALANLGHQVARGTIARVLRDNGVDPAPSRKTSWTTFLRSHWGSIAATDFFYVEVLTTHGSFDTSCSSSSTSIHGASRSRTLPLNPAPTCSSRSLATGPTPSMDSSESTATSSTIAIRSS